MPCVPIQKRAATILHFFKNSRARSAAAGGEGECGDLNAPTFLQFVPSGNKKITLYNPIITLNFVTLTQTQKMRGFGVYGNSIIFYCWIVHQ